MPEYQRSTGLFRLGFWSALLLCTYLALMPAPESPVFRISDVVLHGCAFMALTFALQLAYLSTRWLLAAMLMLVYGIAIEVLQGFIPSRFPEIKDLLVDATGIGIGVALYALIGSSVEQLTRRIVG